MAYMNQERKKVIADLLKKVLSGTGIKYSLSVRHHSAIVVTIKSGPIDFVENYNEVGQSKHDFQPNKDGHISVNNHWYKDHFSGRAMEILHLIISACNQGNHDNSDPMTDYFDVGWYVDINIGGYRKPYIFIMGGGQ